MMKANYTSPRNSKDSSPNSSLKQAEEALQAEHNKLLSLMEAMEYTVTIQDKEYNIIYQNEQSRIASGGDHVGEKCYRAYEGREKICDECPVKEAFKNGKSHTAERKTTTRGKVVFWENTASPIRDAKGKIVSCLELARDVTERKQVEETLIESEGKYRTLVENIPQKIFFKNKDSVYISCNSNYAEDLQLKPAEISGHTDYDFYPRELAEKYRTDDKRVIESGNTERIEERYIEHGQERTVETFKTPFIDESGKTVGVLGIFHDITKQKEMERQSHEREIAEARAQELNISQQRLIKAQESLRKDIASQLHGTVQSRLILLEHKIAELEARALSKRMTKELAAIRQRLEELRNEHIRSISHRLFPSILRMGIATGLESLIDEYSAKLPVDLRVSKKLRDREQANRKLIPDNVKLALYRIAEEALTNISKHTPSANNIRVNMSLSDSRILHLTVRDDGPGSNTTSPSPGIGLSLISDYAAAAGGSCTIKNIPGRGTRVTAKLSLARLETGQ